MRESLTPSSSLLPDVHSNKLFEGTEILWIPCLPELAGGMAADPYECRGAGWGDLSHYYVDSPEELIRSKIDNIHCIIRLEQDPGMAQPMKLYLEVSRDRSIELSLGVLCCASQCLQEEFIEIGFGHCVSTVVEPDPGQPAASSEGKAQATAPQRKRRMGRRRPGR